MTTETWIYVRSTINMAGVARGDEFWIDAEQEHFGPLLEARFLKPIDAPAWELPPSEWTDDERADWGIE